MIYRHDLIDHFSWLAGSEYLDEAIDEALVAIAFSAAGHGGDLVNTGAAWMFADDFVWKFELQSFVEQASAARVAGRLSGTLQSGPSDSLAANVDRFRIE